MRNLKKVVGILAAITMVASMTACGGSTTAPTTKTAAAAATTAAPATTAAAKTAATTKAAEIASTVASEVKGTTAASGKKYKVAFLPTDMSATFASWLADELTKAFKDYPDMELTIIDSKNVLETQLSAMETCVAQKYDYVILLPLQPAAEDDIVKGYIEKGTPFMMINLDDLQVEKASSVIANPYDLGTIVANYALTKLPKDAQVVVLLGPSGNTDSIERRHAYQDIIFSKNPNIKILDEQIGDWEKSKGMSLMENWIQVYGDKINAVISMNDAMAIGAYEAAKEAGIADKLQFYGVDGLADAAVSINNGELTATALQDAQVMAKEGAKICHDVLTGANKEGFKKEQIDVTLITKDNVADFIKRYTDNGMIKDVK